MSQVFYHREAALTEGFRTTMNAAYILGPDTPSGLSDFGPYKTSSVTVGGVRQRLRPGHRNACRSIECGAWQDHR